MNLLQNIIFLFLVLFITGCDLIYHRQFHDPSLQLQQKDYENLLKPPPCLKPDKSFLPKKSVPPKMSSEFLKPVSLAVSEGAPLREVLIELGQQSGIGIGLKSEVLNENIGIYYQASGTPFLDVLKDLCQLTGHRFEIQGKRVLIESDTPYLVTYNVQFLNQVRKNENRVSVSTDVFSPLENQGRSENGSDSVLSNQIVNDFWAELEKNLALLLSVHSQKVENSLIPYTIHKQAGLIMVRGTAHQQEKVNEFLEKLKESCLTQVLIEAKIIEVSLENEYKTGINWRELGHDIHLTAPLGSIARPYSFKKPPPSLSDQVTFAVEHEEFSVVLNLVKKFGTVRTLSNPRLTVMNNQPAMLKVATNEVFFHLEFERYLQADGKPDIENISSNALTIPIGLVMLVQPSVDLQTGEITMTLRPTLSRIQKQVEDPAVAIKSRQNVKSTVPVVQVRELDSVLKMKSGQVLVMGGLMEDRASYTSSSVPLADSLPILGELARGKDDEQKMTELVIFLTAHIVENPQVSEADERIYQNYTEDPRPLNF